MSYAIGDLDRSSGNAPPFFDGEMVDGQMTIVPATIYLGTIRWWDYTDNPKQLFCRICKEPVTNYYLAIDRHVRTMHTPDQI
jgi:hypothetical protein